MENSYQTPDFSKSDFSLLDYFLAFFCAASATNYAIANAFHFPTFVSPIIIFSPVVLCGIKILLTSHRAFIPASALMDFLILTFTSLRVIQATYAIGDFGPVALGTSLISILVYYFLGRAICVLVDYKRFFTTYTIAAVAAVLAAAPFLDVTGYDRASFGDATPVGISQGYMIAAVLLLGTWRTWKLAAVISVPAFIAIIYSLSAIGTRSALLSIALAGMVYFSTWVWKKGPWAIAGVVAAALGGLIMLHVFFSGYVIDINDRYSRAFGSILSELRVIDLGYISDRSTEERQQIWDFSGQLFANHPLFGCGAGCAEVQLGGLSPHNIILEAAVDGGAVSGLLMLVILGIGVHRAVRPLNARGGEFAVISACFVALLLQYNISFALDNSRTLFFFLGFIVSAHRLLKIPSLPAPEPARRLESPPIPVNPRNSRGEAPS